MDPYVRSPHTQINAQFTVTLTAVSLDEAVHSQLLGGAANN